MHQNIDEREKRNESQQASAEREAAPARHSEPPRSRGEAEGKAKRGRPRLLSAEGMNTICKLINVGCSRRSAARYFGCSPATIVNQMRRDPRFADEVRKAEVRRMFDPLTNLRAQSSHSWRAAAWLLERMDREQFGRQLVEVASWQEVEKLFHSWAELSTESISDPQARELMQARAKKLIAEVKRCHRHY